MARRTQKSLQSLARELAHRDEELSNFERRLFWTRLLSQKDPARAIAVMGSSANPIDRHYVRCAATAGHEAARLSATVDLAIASTGEPNPDLSTKHDIFAWHDWPSFEMDLASWLAALPKAAVLRELKERVAAGLPRSTAQEIARLADCGDL